MTVHIGLGTTSPGDPLPNIAVFAACVLLTFYLVHRAGRRGAGRAGDRRWGTGGQFSGPHNGLAITGDYLSAAAFLGVTGAIAINGQDGFRYAAGFLVAWLLVLLLVAELVRNTGRSSLGDVLAYRMRQRPVRAAAATSTLVVSFFYLLAQFAGAGGLVALLLDVRGTGGHAVVVAVVGLVMIGYVLVGSARATTWMQIVKTVLLLLCVALMTAFLLGKFGWNVAALLEEAVNNNVRGARLLDPGAGAGPTAIEGLDVVSLALALVLGAACLPQVLTRFYAVPDAVQARRSAAWTIGALAGFYTAALVIGYGASALVGSRAIESSVGGENSAVPLLAFEIGGTLLLGIVCAVVFAIILAVVAGLTRTASASFARDVYAGIVRSGTARPDAEVKVARITAVVLGALAVGGAILVSGQNVALLVALAFAVAASTNLSTLLFALFWQRFNTAGALCGMYGGLLSCLALMLSSPLVSGAPTAIFPGADFHLHPLTHPGVVSIPLSFLCAILGTLLSKRPADQRKRVEMEVRSLTGIGG